MGRAWQSPGRSGLYFSVILKPEVSPMEVTQITMMASVAVAKTLERAFDVPARVKWPNDIYIQGRKVCGILAEMAAEADKVRFIVLGIGINVNQSIEELGMLEQIATSLRAQVGYIVSRAELLKTVLEEMDYLYIKWQQEGFDPIKKMWKDLALWIGHMVTVSGLQKTWAGEMVDIDEYGALVIRFADGTRQTFYSGDVSLRMSG
nr:biotin--[acetyl-CoA-carboxylase] ligase [Desulforamulus aquiferis]